MGTGCFGIAYLAENTLNQELRVLKVLKPGLAQMRRFRTQFISEFDVQSKLSHENVVRCFELVEHGKMTDEYDYTQTVIY